MGDFLSTCALSGLSIEHESVRVGLIFITTTRRNPVVTTVEHDERIRMVSPPLWGEDDYFGRCQVENPSDVIESMTLKYVHMMLGMDPIHPAEPVDPLDLYELQRKMGQGDGIAYTDPLGFKGRLGYVLVREDVWKEMVALGREVVYDKRDWEAGFDLALQRPPNSEEMCYGALRGIKTDWWMPKLFLSMTVPAPAHRAEILDSVVQTFFVQTAMSALRMVWDPGCGTSQWGNHIVRRSYFERMAALCKTSVVEDNDSLA